jgi:hypothetical protein
VLTGGSSGVAAIRYFPVAHVAPGNANLFSAGPSNPFGAIVSVDDTELSVFALYAVPN